MNYSEIVQPVNLCVEKLFTNGEYVIPIYQRNYSWTEKEIEQLLEDINDIKDGLNGKYYLGTLIVNQQKPNVFEVVDGQQRLTTLFLIISFLKKEYVLKGSLRFEARDKSNRTLDAILQGDPIDVSKGFLFSKEIMNGYFVIKNYFLCKAPDFETIFLNKLNLVEIIRVHVPQNIDLNHYFEVMNTRGEQLELHEIAKAKIVGAMECVNDKDIAAKIWDACAQMDKYIQMCFPVSVREEIFSDTWDNFIPDSFSGFYKAFSNGEFSNDMRSLNEILYNHEQKSVKQQINNESQLHFESIISFSNFVLQVNEVLHCTPNDNETSLDDKRILELLKANWSDAESAKKFIYALLKNRYLFDKYIIKVDHNDKKLRNEQWKLQHLVKYCSTKSSQPEYKATFSVDDENEMLCYLQSCLRITYTSPKTMHWISYFLRFLNKEKSAYSVRNYLEKYCCDKIVKSNYTMCCGFLIEHIVFTYLDYILWRDNKSEFKNIKVQFRTSIEHFFPQHPDTKSIDIFVSDGVRDSFGNLALITVSSNSKFSNLLPDAKSSYENIIEQSPKLMRMRKMFAYGVRNGTGVR